MGDKIKSAWEKALERSEEKTGQVSQEEILQMEYRAEGQKLAGRFLNDTDFQLEKALEEYEGEKKKAILTAVEETLLSRLTLPENEDSMQENRRVMEGLLAIKHNKQVLRSGFEQLEQLFNQYMQAREQAYESLKQDFSNRLNDAAQRSGGQIEGAGMDPEKHPRFRDEWLKLVGKVNEKFMPSLEGAREQIKQLE